MDVLTVSSILALACSRVAKFNRLPEDLIVDIFGYLIGLDVRIAHHYVKQLKTLSQVCTLWADLIQHSPPLWAHIRLPRPQAECAKSLTLSGAHPLTIDMEAIVSFSHPNWTAVSEHIHRWQSAILYFPREETEDFSALRAPAPILRSLELCSLSESPVKSLDLFEGNAPNLSRVLLYHVALERWDGGIMTGLQSLRLQHIPQLGPSMQQMVSVLSVCPELEHLDISNVQLHYDTSVTQPPSIPLHRLHELHLVGLAQDHMISLLATIQTPLCTKFVLRCLMESHTQPHLLPAITSIVSLPFDTSLLSAGRLTVQLENAGTFSLTCTASHTGLDTFSLTLGYIIPGADVIDWVANALNGNKAALDYHLDIIRTLSPHSVAYPASPRYSSSTTIHVV